MKAVNRTLKIDLISSNCSAPSVFITSNRFDVMSFEKRFDDESKKFRRDKSQIINKRNQKINLIKEVKEVIADLMRSEIEQIERILLRVIEILKADLKENIENSSKLIRTLNRIKSSRVAAYGVGSIPFHSISIP